jgi:hypothetical protein
MKGLFKSNSISAKSVRPGIKKKIKKQNNTTSIKKRKPLYLTLVSSKIADLKKLNYSLSKYTKSPKSARMFPRNLQFFSISKSINDCMKNI